MTPLALVLLAVGPVVTPRTRYLVLLELAFVIAAVCEGKLALPLLLTVDVVTLVLGAVGPLLHAVAVLFILEPVALVPATVEVRVHAIPVGLVVSPLSLVDVAFGVNQSSIAVGHAVLPEAVVPGAIGPNLDSPAVLLVLLDEPLSLVDGSILQDADGPDLPLLVVIDFLGGPVEGLELLDYVHDDLIIVLWLEYLQLLILEELQVGLGSVLLTLVLIGVGARPSSRDFALGGGVFVSGVAASTHS
uniref:Uncharacterized protein n=1 Tax=Strombidium rassoulzadegani TaxID=1082188 RepID=A0A7S3FWY4_9SPIT|mmetsp:Transcript_6423/g.10906  ORF Transcript_6423/g.10906 Transcript_6423/m.10906 type:complete len:246 (+) Transcript_6423:341-1078(+)